MNKDGFLPKSKYTATLRNQSFAASAAPAK